jgi:hypothetical protein
MTRFVLGWMRGGGLEPLEIILINVTYDAKMKVLQRVLEVILYILQRFLTLVFIPVSMTVNMKIRSMNNGVPY